MKENKLIKFTSIFFVLLLLLSLTPVAFASDENMELKDIEQQDQIYVSDDLKDELAKLLTGTQPDEQDEIIINFFNQNKERMEQDAKMKLDELDFERGAAKRIRTERLNNKIDSDLKKYQINENQYVDIYSDGTIGLLVVPDDVYVILDDELSISDGEISISDGGLLMDEKALTGPSYTVTKQVTYKVAKNKVLLYVPFSNMTLNTTFRYYPQGGNNLSSLTPAVAVSTIAYDSLYWGVTRNNANTNNGTAGNMGYYYGSYTDANRFTGTGGIEMRCGPTGQVSVKTFTQ